MSFRDEHERMAHDVICIIKFGGIGGSVRNEDLYRVADVLRGRPFPTAPREVVPTVAHTFNFPIPTGGELSIKMPKVTLPDIKMPPAQPTILMPIIPVVKLP